MERGWGLPGAAGDACRNLGRGSSPAPCAHPRLEGLRDRREGFAHTKPALPARALGRAEGTSALTPSKAKAAPGRHETHPRVATALFRAAR